MKALQDFGWMQISDLDEGRNEIPEGIIAAQAEEDLTLAQLERRLGRVAAALAFLKKYDTRKKPMLAPHPSMRQEELAQVYERRQEILDKVGWVRRLEDDISEMRAAENRIRGRMAQLEPWLELPTEVEALRDTKECGVWVGSIPSGNMAAFQEECQALENTWMEVISTDRESAYLVLAAHRDTRDALLALLSRAGFVQAQFPEQSGTPRQMKEGMEKRLQELETGMQQALAKASTMAEDMDDMERLYDVLTVLAQRRRQGARAGHTRETFCIRGWVPALQVEEMQTLLTGSFEALELIAEDPVKGDDPPTHLENPKMVAPFEGITEMFATPKYKGIDPNTVMAPFYVLFFGMMVSDAMYGLLLAIGAAFFLWRTKPRGSGGLVKVIAYGGVATVFWGIMYGSYFGMEWIRPLLVSPLNQPLETLALCFGLGLLHILVGLVMKMRVSFMEKDWQSAVFDTLPWILILAAVPFLAIGMLMGVSALQTVALVMVLAGVATLVLMSGRGKRNPIMRLGSGLGALYGVTSYLSDILSYARLFAMGLATAVVAMVANEIVKMLMGSWFMWPLAAIVFVAMHIFNVAVNALGAYVHASRLQFIEFFGKFFEGGGRMFSPFGYKAKYHDVVK